MTTEITQAEGTNKIIWVDFLRVVASFFVIMAHVEGMDGNPEWASTIYLILSRIGVPIFFMISGFLLLSKEEPLMVFLEKRAIKVLIPFLAWSIFYDVVWNQELINTGVTLDAILKLFIRILRGPRAHHLWFLYPLIGLYVLVPTLRIFIKNAKKQDILYFIGLWLIIVPILAIIQYYTPFSFGFDLQFASGYIGYFLLGVYLGKIKISKQNNAGFIFLFILGFLSTFLIYIFKIPPEESIHENVYRSYLSLNFIILGIGAFGILKAVGSKLSHGAEKYLTIFGRTSFGIYLIHIIVLEWLSQIVEFAGLLQTPLASLWAIPLTTLTCYLLSFVIIVLLQKIPLIKATVP